MKKLMRNALLIAGFGLMTTQSQPQGHQVSVDQFVEAARRAHDAGQLQSESDDICHAAALDTKYAKQCEKARERTQKALAEFEADYIQAISEAKHQDFPGAVRDLGKITFGPRHDAAQSLLPQLRVLGHMGTPDETSRTALAQASVFYNAGKLDEAESWLKFVAVPGFQATKNQMLTNIRVYRQAMQQANQLLAQHDWNGAAQQLEVATRLSPVGPGDPQKQLKQVQEKIAADQSAAQQQQAAASVAQEAEKEAKIRPLLKLARKEEASGNTSAAGNAYAAVLAIDPARKEALAGRKRTEAKPSDDSNSLETLLEHGVTQFYSARYSEAGDSLNAYIAKGGKIHAGAAQFYLGAALTARQLLADPQDDQGADDLRQQAQQHFAEARKLKFAPIEAAVSPKILAQWSQTE